MSAINPRRKYTTAKIDAEFMKEMQDLAKQRYFKNLAKKLPSLPEMTRLLRRSPAWNNVVFDLRTKPKREDA